MNSRRNPKNINPLLALALSAGLGLAAGCDDADATRGEGTLGVAIWGEEFIETGIPASEFADGYGVTFDSFLINVGEIAVAREGEEPTLTAPAFRIYDLAALTGPLAITTTAAPAAAYGHTAYTLAPATAGSETGNATAADRQLLVDHGWSLYVAGQATNGTVTITFAWGFTTQAVYDPCHSTAAVPDGGQATVQLTIHGDHLFYDDATSEEPALRFTDIAQADVDADGEVTLEELAAYDITALPNYGVGSLDIDDLRGFLEHMVATVGHIDGEGHCSF